MLVTRFFTEIIPYSFEDQRKRNLEIAKTMLGNQKKRD